MQTCRKGLHQYEAKDQANKLGCPECRKITNSKYQKAHPERIKANRKANIDAVRVSGRKYFHSDKGRENHYQSNFGISFDYYNFMFEEQGGCCAICLEHQCNLDRRLAVDHSHNTGQVRGLLCKDCNTSIGKMKDSPTMLRMAAFYLELELSNG